MSKLGGEGLGTFMEGVNQLQTGFIKGIGNAVQNRMQNKYDKSVYDYQRQKDIEFWQMSNDYNSPAAQMQRLKDAGLNPNLVYGSGSAVATGDQLKASGGAQARQLQNVQPAFESQLMTMYDLEGKRLQNDNLKAQNDLMKQKLLLEQFDLSFKEDARLDQLGIISGKNRNQDADFLLKDQSWKFNELKNAATLEQMAAQLNISKQSYENAKKDGRLKDLDIKLRENGVYPGDPLWARFGIMLIAKYLGVDLVDILPFYLSN